MNARAGRALIWSVAGTDSGGGAGLAADQRAAQAWGVHLGALVAAVTAQNSRRVADVHSVPLSVLQAQWDALAQDMPPAAIKTGLLPTAAHIELVARGIDRLRERAPVALVVDPVLRASSGQGFADESALEAYRQWLLPRASLVTPNRAEAAILCGLAPAAAPDVPAMAQRLRALGAHAVCITGGDANPAGQDAELAQDWVDTPLAQAWLALPRQHAPHNHGTGCTFATSAACALALGFASADALVLAKMCTTLALRQGYAAGAGPGPVLAQAGFAIDPSLMPVMSWDTQALLAWPHVGARAWSTRTGLYAIVDRAARVQAVLDAGVRTVQLRIKQAQVCASTDALDLAQEIAQAVQACTQAGAQLIVNDHWRQASLAGAKMVHLGQEDVLALGPAGRAELQASGLSLGLSSHSLWELCRARALQPAYVACGPVWPTLTKAMPWRAQGLHNLRWWQAMAGLPVVAIGGILQAEQVAQAAACGVSAVCVVRGLGEQPQAVVPALAQALAQGWRRHAEQAQASPPGDGPGAAPELPLPSLDA